MVGNGERHTCWWQPNKRAIDDEAWVDRDWNHHLSQARHTCGWKSWWLLLHGRVEEFSEDDLTLVLCNQWFVHCLILIFIRVSLGVFFYENHSPPPIEENQVKGKISQGTSSALLLALVLLLSAVSVLLLTSWRPPWTLACPAQCCSSLRIRAW